MVGYVSGNPEAANSILELGEKFALDSGAEEAAVQSGLSALDNAGKETEDSVAAAPRTFEDTVVNDKDLGFKFDSSYDPGAIQQDHPWSRAVREALQLPPDDATQALEALTNAYKGQEEGEIVAEINAYIQAGMDPQDVLEAVSDQLDSLARSGAGPNFPFGWGPYYLDPPF